MFTQRADFILQGKHSHPDTSKASVVFTVHIMYFLQYLFIARSFILFDAIVDRIVLLILFLSCSLLLYINTTDFYILKKRLLYLHMYNPHIIAYC